MKWIDTLDIAIALSEKYPDQDPLKARFVDLHDWVMGLPGFADDQFWSAGFRLNFLWYSPVY